MTEQKFWLDWGAQIFVGVATILIALSAVFGEACRALFIRLSLAIDSVYGTDQSYVKGLMGGGQQLGQSGPKAARYYRLRVQNDGCFFSAQHTDVWLLQVDRKEPNGLKTWRCELPLIWQHRDFKPGPRNIREHPAFADLFSISEEGNLALQVVSAPIGFPALINSACELWVTVQARSSEKSSAEYRIHITWDGRWNSEPGQMHVTLEIVGVSANPDRPRPVDTSHAETPEPLVTAPGNRTQVGSDQRAPSRKWRFWFSKDPAMFWVGVAGVLAVIIYTVVSDWQLNEMNASRMDSESQLRPVLGIINPQMTPYDSTGKWIDKKNSSDIAGWLVSPGWKDVGATRAEHFKFGYKLELAPMDGVPAEKDMVKRCPPEPSLNDPPNDPGSILPSGAENGKIAIADRLPLEIAEAAERGKYSVVFVINADYNDAFVGSPVHHAYACVWIGVNEARTSEFNFLILRERGN